MFFLPKFVRRLRYLLILVLSVILVTVAYPLLRTSAPVVESNHPPLKFAYSLWIGYFPIAIAQEKGFFAQEGIAVETFEEDLGLQNASFAANKYDGMGQALGNIIPLLNLNPHFRIVALIDQSKGADAIISQPQIKTVTDLKNKVIGVKLGDFGELFVSQMLSNNGLTIEEVKLSNNHGVEVPKLLKAGEIQAGHTWVPYISQLKTLGFNVLFTSKRTPGLISDVMIFQDQVLRERPEDVKAFLRAWFKAVDYWLTHFQEGNRIIAQYYHIKPEDLSLEGLKIYTARDNLKAFTMPDARESIHHTAQLYANFALQKGNLTRPINLKSMLDSSFLPSNSP